MRGSRLAGIALLAASGCFGEWVGTVQEGTTTGATASSSSSTAALPQTTSSSSSTSGLDPSTSTSSTGSTTGSSLVCEHLNVLLLVDISVSMAPYGQGILSTVVALGANTETIFGEVADYHIGFTFNAPMAINENAFELPRGRTCSELGMLLRGQGGCAGAFEGRPYISAGDPLTESLTCLASGLFSPVEGDYEHRLTLGALDAFFNVDEVPAVTECNGDFHEPGEPLIVVVITDEEDVSTPELINLYLIRAIQSQGGTSLANVGFLVIGADAESCGSGGGGSESGSGGETMCEAVPSCNVNTFLDQAYAGFEGDRVRRVDLCRAADIGEAGALAQEIAGHLSDLYAVICG